MWRHRFNRWYAANKANVNNALSASVLPTAWCLVTWSFVDFDVKLWARSIGLMLFTYLVIEFATAYYIAKAKEKRDAIDRNR